MAIIVNTGDPQTLLKCIKKGIDDGVVKSWSYDDDGDFTHDSKQWNEKAWLRPKLYSSELRFGIIPPKDTEIIRQIYGIYHGRFIDMLLTHFNEHFIYVTATSYYTDPDGI